MSVALARSPPDPGSGSDDQQELLEFLYRSPVGIIQSDRGGEISMLNPYAVSTLAPYAGTDGFRNLRSLLRLICPAVLAQFDAYDGLSGEICSAVRFRVGQGVDGVAEKHLEISITRLSARRDMTVIRDVTEEQRREDEVHRQSERLRAVCEGVRDYGIFTLDQDGRIDSWNNSGQRLTGLTSKVANGQPLQTFLDKLFEEPLDAGDLLTRTRRDGWVEFEGWARTGEDRRFWCNGMVSTLHDAAGQFDGYSVVARNLTDRKSYELRLRQLAEIDPLTGVFNRRSFLEALDSAIGRARAGHEGLAFAMLDIDHFKRLNDTHGHAVGDEALKLFASTLSDALRRADVLGRLGGEEFGLVMAQVTRKQAEALAERVRGLVEAIEVPVEKGSVRFTVSIGLAMLDDPARDTADTLISRADAALYMAKEAGRNRVETA